ncbi:MAG: hypothetical protein CMQ75_00145 [Gammaproteobacteria bacterium]|nr:hypothetical protein [Gammaproteobacteria bacterium]|tara:strand:+ start:1088 stop:1636 length:549 start_codon:yes stop_codon:yes gene_type:complete
MARAFANQIENRNFLSPIGFKFTLAKEPKVSFFSNSAIIPDITLGTAIQPAYLKDIDIPGDKLQYSDFSFRFLVDESLENYMKIHNWLKGLGYPETTEQFKKATTDEDGLRDREEIYSDGSLHILNSSYNSIAIVKFSQLFPINLTSLQFEATDTDVNYFTAEVTFKYTVYNIVEPDGRTPL